MDRTYSVLLVSAMILQLFILAMTIHFVKEPAPRQNTSPPFIQLKKLLLEIGSSLKSCRRITSIIFMAFAGSFASFLSFLQGPLDLPAVSGCLYYYIF